MNNQPMASGTVFCVAVFCPTGWYRYGGMSTFDTEKAAMNYRNSLLALDHKIVHVWKTTTKLLQE